MQKELPISKFAKAASTTASRRTMFEAKGMLNEMQSPLVSDLIKTKAVSRLKDVAFLGAIDYSPWAKGSGAYLTSRFDHSVGVARLVHRAARTANLDVDLQNIALAAGLLHDIGHGPLSHSLETDFEGEFGVNHHDATDNLLTGESAAAKELRMILLRHNLEPVEVLDLISGHGDHPFNQLFCGPINFDTIEGILRTAHYGFKPSVPLAANLVVDAAIEVLHNKATENNIHVLDSFWQLKGLIYSQFVRSKVGVVSDFKCHSFFSEHRQSFSPDQFSWTDSKLRQRFPSLFAWLSDESDSNVGIVDIPYVRRIFSVSDSHTTANRPSEWFHLRYKQRKEGATYKWSEKRKTINNEETLWNITSKFWPEISSAKRS